MSKKVSGWPLIAPKTLPEGLPDIEEGDAGKVLTVGEDGPEWAEAGGGLPEITNADEGKVLMVVDNSGTLEAEWTEASGGGGVPSLTPVFDEVEVTTASMGGVYAAQITTANLSGEGDLVFYYNGIPYPLEKGSQGYGATASSQTPDFTDYPFGIIVNGINTFLVTQDAETATICAYDVVANAGYLVQHADRDLVNLIIACNLISPI